MSKYTWIVTRDTHVGETSDAIGKIGPSAQGEHAPFNVVILEGEQFRLLNEQGETEFLGYIYGDYGGGEPLEDFGRDNGCTQIEYQRNGTWVTLTGMPHSRL